MIELLLVGALSSCAVTVHGDPELVAAIHRWLLPVSSGPQCQAVDATLVQHSDHIEVRLNDGARGSKVRTAQGAAALIGSWAQQQELELGLEPSSAISPTGPRPELGLLLEGGYAASRAGIGGALSFYLAPIGDFRPLLLARFESTLAAETSQRRTADLVAGLGLPIDFASLSIQPEIGLGARLTSTLRSEGQDTLVVQDSFADDRLTPVGELALGVSHALSERFSLFARASASFAPFAHADPIVPGYANELSEEEQLQFALEGSPQVSSRIGVGGRLSL